MSHAAPLIPGSTCVPHVGFGVPPKRTLKTALLESNADLQSDASGKSVSAGREDQHAGRMCSPDPPPRPHLAMITPPLPSHFPARDGNAENDLPTHSPEIRHAIARVPASRRESDIGLLDVRKPDDKVDIGLLDVRKPSDKVDIGLLDVRKPSDKVDIGLLDVRKPSDKVDIGVLDVRKPDDKVDIGVLDVRKPNDKVDIEVLGIPIHSSALKCLVLHTFYAFLIFATAFPASAETDKYDPAAELASFKLPPGFEANLFASEKDGVIKPIQIRWDTRGRLWVIQSTTYPQLQPGEVPNDKVLILEDTDGDGRADKTTVFADGLMIPTGLEIAPPSQEVINDYKNRQRASRRAISTYEQLTGRYPDSPQAAEAQERAYALKVASAANTGFPSACYVGEGTKLLLLTDTDGDGKCDKREVVLRGFGTGDNHQNINSFRWSPGGELLFSQGLHGHARIETPHGIVPLDEAGFWRYRPREGRLDSFYGGPADPQNPWGFVWTDWGQMLMVAGNNGGIYYPLPEMIRGHRYGRREQIWKNARGRKSSGPDIIGTAHLPPEWQGVMLTGGYINNAVWALKIEDDGAGFAIADFGLRIADSEKADAASNPQSAIHNPQSELPPGYFVQSSHPSFRPVDVKVGPDGAIYLCDWYNPIIGHYQASFRHPDRDKAHGRIWRITYKGRPLVKPPQIAGAPLEALFENLKSGERWVREQTKRELAGRETGEVVPALKKWCLMQIPEGFQRGGSWEINRANEHALCEAVGVFEAHGSIEADMFARQVLAKAKDPNIRAYTAGIFPHYFSHELIGDRVLAPLGYLARDPHPRVRLAAAVALGNIPSPLSAKMLLEIENPYGDESQKPDKLLDFALRTAVVVLKPQWEPALDPTNLNPLGSAQRERLAELQRPPGAAKPQVGTAVPSRPRVAEGAGENIQHPTSNTQHPMPSATPGRLGEPSLPAFGKVRATPEVVAALVKEVRESGDAKHGGDVYRRAELACVACHSIEDKGGKIGPPLDAIGSGQPLDFIIGTVLEPQREIKESYEAMEITAKDGRKATGYIVARDPAFTTLRDPATGTETRFATAEIAGSKMLGSFMPAGLIDNLSRTDLRDLFAYLAQLGKPR